MYVFIAKNMWLKSLILFCYMWLKFNEYLENVLKLRKFWTFLINLLMLYGLLLIIFYVIYKILMLYPLEFNIVFMIVLMVGLLIDTRFTKRSVFILIGLILIQILVYRYLELIPILIIKDIFWFSVVLNISFIWHICILQWIFKISDLMKWELLMFITRSLGVLTSMTFILWIINWIDYIRSWIEGAGLMESHEEDIKNWYKKRNPNLTNEELEEKCNRLGENGLIFFYTWEFVMWLLRNMVLYFIRIFYNYSMLITGKKNISLKYPLQVWIFVIVTFIVSIWIMVPRIYIIWVILIIFEILRIYKIIKKEYIISCYPKEFKDPLETKRVYNEFCKAVGGKWNMIRLFILKNGRSLIEKIMVYADDCLYLEQYAQIFNYIEGKTRSELDRGVLYVKNYTRFYDRFDVDYSCHRSWVHRSIGTIATFDLCDLFIYRKDMVKNIVGNLIISYSEWGYSKGIIIEYSEDYMKDIKMIDMKSIIENNPEYSIEELNKWKKEEGYIDYDEYGSYLYRNYVDKTTGAFHHIKKDITLFEYLFGVDEGRYLYGCFVDDPGKVYISKKYIKK